MEKCVAKFEQKLLNLQNIFCKLLWLMIYLTSARGRLLNVYVAINRPIVINSL